MSIHAWPGVLPGTAAVRYAHLILDRVRDGMPNDDWKVDWTNAPLTVADHRDATLRLMDADVPADSEGTAPRALSRTIAAVCLSAYGITGPRLNVNLNDRPEVHARVANVKWGRGAASGGGRYGIDLYLVHGGDDALDAGVYHFNVIANGWEQLQRHDRTREVRGIQGYVREARSYLVATVNFWRSAFKYSDFAYQATAMDVGTFFGAQWETLGDDVAGTWDMEVDETRLAALLGIDPQDQGVYAVQAWGPIPAGPEREVVRPVPAPVTAFRRDRAVVRFPTATALQDDMRRESPDVSARAKLAIVPDATVPDDEEVRARDSDLAPVADADEEEGEHLSDVEDRGVGGDVLNPRRHVLHGHHGPAHESEPDDDDQREHRDRGHRGDEVREDHAETEEEEIAEGDSEDAERCRRNELHSEPGSDRDHDEEHGLDDGENRPDRRLRREDVPRPDRSGPQHVEHAVLAPCRDVLGTREDRDERDAESDDVRRDLVDRVAPVRRGDLAHPEDEAHEKTRGEHEGEEQRGEIAEVRCEHDTRERGGRRGHSKLRPV